MAKTVKHVYGNCQCGKFHPRPKVKQVPNGVTTYATKDNPLFSPLRTMVLWFIEAFAFSVVFGAIFNNSSPSLTGAAFIAYFLIKIGISIAKDFTKRFRERMKNYGNRNK